MSELPTFTYSRWRHGGWYVHEVHYPSGAIGCVSRNYSDRKWRIVCDPRPFEQRPTFRTRDEAAAAEWNLAAQEYAQVPPAVSNLAGPKTHSGPDHSAARLPNDR